MEICPFFRLSPATLRPLRRRAAGLCMKVRSAEEFPMAQLKGEVAIVGGGLSGMAMAVALAVALAGGLVVGDGAAPRQLYQGRRQPVRC